ncbi:GIY-YIG nuclease family protein [Streptomyces sp. DT18]
MSHSARGRAMTPRPYVPSTVKTRPAWTGVPGAGHIPSPNAPEFGVFTYIAAEWAAAGVEMTEQAIQAIAKLAKHRLDARLKAEAWGKAKERRREALVVETPPPGTFGDEPGAVVYYIRRGEAVKIGTSGQLRHRMAELMPDEVLAVEPGSYTLEAQLHARFAHIRLDPNREYFRLTSELARHIEAVRERCGPPPPGLPQLKDLLDAPSVQVAERPPEL